MAELSSLVKGLQMAVQNQHSCLIFEGDSQVIIQLATRILNGHSPWRASPSWRLLGLMEDFKALISPNLTLIPSHVKREANKVADLLANKGIDTKADLMYWQASISAETELSRQCKNLASKDLQAPYGVTAGEGMTFGFHLSRGLNDRTHPFNASPTDAG